MADSSAHQGVTTPSPSGRASVDPFAPTPRENTPPRDELDATDRLNIRTTRSVETLEIQIKLDNHREWLAWLRTIRYLIFYGGLVALTAAFALGLKYANVPPQDIAKLTFLALASGISGYGLRALTGKIRNAISSRNTSDQRQSSR
jgi:hypothetical protein